jgi:hypothetical protein
MTLDPRVSALLQQLRASGFQDVSGARASVTLPISAPLLNMLIGMSIPANAPVRELEVHPQSSNRLMVRVRLARPAFLPPINLGLTVERQPELPASPEIVFRMTSLPGLMSLAGAAMSFANVLPPGIRMVGDRIVVDLAAQLARFGQAHLLQYARRVHVSTEEGRLILDLGAQISPAPDPSN